MTLFDRLRCWMDLHDAQIVDTSDDPFVSHELVGHMGTIRCSRCKKMRRVLGYDGNIVATLPWLKYP